MMAKPPQVLPALAFAAFVLGAVHLGTFVWLAAFVYGGNIRGYVPAGITGMSVLAAAVVALLLYMGWLGRRRGSGGYVAAGCLGLPLALFMTSAYAGLAIRLLGYSFETDVVVSSVGAGLCLAIAIALHWRWLGKRRDRDAASSE